MKVKIISDGTHRGTRVVNAETGEEIERVVVAEWRHVAGEAPVAELTFWRPEIEVEGEVQE